MALAAAVALGVAGLIFVTAPVVYADRVLPNTRVAGVDLGGLSADESRARLGAAARRMGTETVTFAYEGALGFKESSQHPRDS